MPTYRVIVTTFVKETVTTYTMDAKDKASVVSQMDAIADGDLQLEESDLEFESEGSHVQHVFKVIDIERVE
jgi:hypothetical protein